MAALTKRHRAHGDTMVIGARRRDRPTPDRRAFARDGTAARRRFWDGTGTSVPCPGTGQDGDLRKGLTLAYVDNGDGTITDMRTGLTWEKQSNADGSVHDLGNYFTWDQAFSHVATLNAAMFAGHGDWRLPNVKELLSIEDFEHAGTLATPPAFDTNCDHVCSVLTCSCTQAGFYWSSTTYASAPLFGVTADFVAGGALPEPKYNAYFGARAVRGGP